MGTFRARAAVSEGASVLIHRCPETVFRFIGEEFFNNYPRWSPEVQELKPVGSALMRVGTQARQVRVDLGHRSESIFSVTFFQQGRRICFEGISSAYRCDYHLEAVAWNSSTILGFTFELPVLEMCLRPFESLIGDAIRNGVERTVQAVKRLVEAVDFEQETHHRQPLPCVHESRPLFPPFRASTQSGPTSR
jgi:Polyketide cyclase / dehydrase and lipid transport